MKSVLVDASSAILLYKSDLFDQLLSTYRVMMAGAVYEEITRSGYPGANAFASCHRQRQCIIVRLSPEKERVTCPLKRTVALGQGEKETILLYLRGNADFIMIDDGKGAGFCRQQQIPYINALLFPRILYFCHQLTAVDLNRKMEQLVSLGRYSNRIIHYAATCSRQKIDDFFPN